ASSYADYLDLRRSSSLAGLAAYVPFGASIQRGAATSRIEARIVSDNYFSVLDRPLFRGGWRSDDTMAGSTDVIVSHRFWSTTLGGDPSVIGGPIVVNGHPL